MRSKATTCSVDEHMLQQHTVLMNARTMRGLLALSLQDVVINRFVVKTFYIFSIAVTITVAHDKWGSSK